MGSSRGGKLSQLRKLRAWPSWPQAVRQLLRAAQGTELLTACLDTLQLRVIRMLVFFL